MFYKCTDVRIPKYIIFVVHKVTKNLKNLNKLSLLKLIISGAFRTIIFCVVICGSVYLCHEEISIINVCSSM